jgi:hypothetical protein
MADKNQVLAAVAQQAKSQPSPFDEDTEVGEPLPPEKFPGANDKVEVETRSNGREAEPVDIEIVDDRPPADQERPRAQPKEQPVEVPDKELSQYSESVQKRLRQMSHEYHTERRAREEQERQAAEATRVAQDLYRQNQRLQDLAYRGRDAYYSESAAKAEASLAAARAVAEAAYEGGDAKKIVAANEEVARWVAEKAKIEATVAMQEPRPQPQPQPQPQQPQPQRQQPQQPQQPEISIETQRWMKENPWFGKDRDASMFAMHLHQVAVTQEFLRPDTPEYFAFIDQNTKKRFPEVYAVDDARQPSASNGSATQRVATRSPVVAPVRRTSAGRKVQMTATQVSLARRLGLTNEQYARQLIIEQGAE